MALTCPEHKTLLKPKPGVGSDVAKRIAARVAKAEAQRANRSEQRFRLAMQATHDWLWEWDIPRNRISWTDSLYSMHQVDKESFDATLKGELVEQRPLAQPSWLRRNCSTSSN